MSYNRFYLSLPSQQRLGPGILATMPNSCIALNSPNPIDLFANPNEPPDIRLAMSRPLGDHANIEERTAAGKKRNESGVAVKS